MILKLYDEKINRFFRSRLSSAEEVEDLCQECACAIIAGYHRFRGKSSVATWVYGICRNVLSNYYYYKERDIRLYEVARQLASSGEPDKPDVGFAIEKLPKEYRRLYLHYYVDGLSIKEIARLTGRPDGTIKFLLFDLRRRVRSLLE